jgi:hypothetical protein
MEFEEKQRQRKCELHRADKLASLRVKTPAQD